MTHLKIKITWIVDIRGPEVIPLVIQPNQAHNKDFLGVKEPCYNVEPTRELLYTEVRY